MPDNLNFENRDYGALDWCLAVKIECGKIEKRGHRNGNIEYNSKNVSLYKWNFFSNKTAQLLRCALYHLVFDLPVIGFQSYRLRSYRLFPLIVDTLVIMGDIRGYLLLPLHIEEGGVSGVFIVFKNIEGGWGWVEVLVFKRRCFRARESSPVRFFVPQLLLRETYVGESAVRGPKAFLFCFENVFFNFFFLNICKQDFSRQLLQLLLPWRSSL